MFKIIPSETAFVKFDNNENFVDFSLISPTETDSFNEERKFLPKRFIITKSDKNFLEKKKNRKSLKNKSDINSNGRWTKEEHNRFIESIILYGNDWKKIQKYVKTRTSTQARSHAQKFLMKLKNSEFLKNKKIDLNYSWAKAISLIKKSFNEDELKVIFSSVKNFEGKKNKSKKLLRLSLNENTFSSSNYDGYSENYEDDNFTCQNSEDNEFFENFMKNFNNKRKLSYELSLNDFNSIFCENK
jgi:SHAQKYF class myb-like DNA-binding protein